MNLRTLRLGVSLIGSMGRMTIGIAQCTIKGDPTAADDWLRDSIVPSLMRATGARVHPPDRVPSLPDAPYIIIANHQSHLDVPLIAMFLPVSLRMVAKPSLFKVPVPGRYMKVAGHLMARRKAEVVQASLQLFEAGHSVGFFPEGTRTPEGTLGPFKAGAFLLAVQSGRPILPVAVFGTGGVLPSGSNSPQPGPVGLRFGEPIPPSEDADALMESGRAALSALLEAGPPATMAAAAGG